MRVYAFDIGGSSIKHALIQVANGNASITDRFPSIQLDTFTLRELVTRLTAALHGHFESTGEPLSTIGISTTGSVDDSGRVLRAGHFQDYQNTSWSEILTDRFQQVEHVLTINDGRASTWAEYTLHRSGSAPFVHFVLGTGIGGGIVSDGALVPGADSAAGGFGHIKVSQTSDIPCSCKRFGCVETFAAAPAIVRSYVKKAGIDPESVQLAQVVAASRDGNTAAKAAFEEAGEWLGMAISNVMNMLNPSAITLGGGLALAASEAIEDTPDSGFLKAAVETARGLALPRIATKTVIKPAEYGNDGGLIGAALLATSTGRRK
ncbi:ROK family protein [Actinosynnema sp. CS-041913]|uniref:ROK family protein n=1 Tax=Actinosynnema sp. CS-041913 TaxID=3239917 RepID=UPI003D95071C